MSCCAACNSEPEPDGHASVDPARLLAIPVSSEIGHDPPMSNGAGAEHPGQGTAAESTAPVWEFRPAVVPAAPDNRVKVHSLHFDGNFGLRHEARVGTATLHEGPVRCRVLGDDLTRMFMADPSTLQADAAGRSEQCNDFRADRAQARTSEKYDITGVAFMGLGLC